ncbi:hypothetical protein FZC79_18465 [Rossellomorea vietnamensis]|uniref:NADH dehydrogenase subunit 1 n=1 Tax=Rossellomorea vietnamensis TaxID=218284 RepID=A0A5D4K815_9BACI|nr:hypothetical protein [Rossellomorea vietnamensis]TYR73428.1 hypothetical protein FZC79_18465 [Rossellomorea vietnamensis]
MGIILYYLTWFLILIEIPVLIGAIVITLFILISCILYRRKLLKTEGRIPLRLKILGVMIMLPTGFILISSLIIIYYKVGMGI